MSSLNHCGTAVSTLLGAMNETTPNTLLTSNLPAGKTWDPTVYRMGRLVWRMSRRLRGGQAFKFNIFPDEGLYIWDTMGPNKEYKHHGHGVICKEYQGQNWDDLPSDVQRDWTDFGCQGCDAKYPALSEGVAQGGCWDGELTCVGLNLEPHVVEGLRFILENGVFQSVNLQFDDANIYASSNEEALEQMRSSGEEDVFKEAGATMRQPL